MSDKRGGPVGRLGAVCNSASDVESVGSPLLERQLEVRLRARIAELSIFLGRIITLETK
jgi:hypothetical protein